MTTEFSAKTAGVMSRQINLPISGAMLGLLLAILLLAFEQRYQAIDKTVVENPLRGDAFRYFVIAHNLNNYGVYSSDQAGLKNASQVKPDAVISPGYPLFMSAFLHDREEEGDFERLLMAQAVLGTLTVLLTFFIARQMLPLWASAVAMFLTAVSPHLVSLTTYFLTETLFTFLLALGVLLTQLSFKRRSVRLGVGAGVVLAAAALTRPSLQYFAPFLLIATFAIRTLPKRPAVAVFLGFMVGMSPWWVRNYTAIGLSSDSTLMASTLHHGSYPGLMFEGRPETYGYPYRFDPDARADGSSVTNALAAIRKRVNEDPGEMIRWYLFGKPYTFWQWNLTESIGDVFVYPTIDSPYFRVPHFRLLHHGMRVIHGPLVLAGALGIFLTVVLAWRARAAATDHELIAAFIVAALIAYMIALHVIGAPFPRYSVPLRPYIYVLAILLLQRVARLAFRLLQRR